jgi:hypothetical protein
MTTGTEPTLMNPEFVKIAEQECAPALKIVRENYRPSKGIEDIMIAAFIHGAGWACANLMPKEH